MIYQKTLEFPSTGHGDIHDLTEEIARIVDESEVSTGTVHVFAVGSTAAISVVEFES